MEPAGQKYPAAQGPLHAAEFKPTEDVLNQVPAGQAVQLAAPAKLYRPGRQMEAVALVEPAGQKYPAAQGPLQANEVKSGLLPQYPEPH